MIFAFAVLSLIVLVYALGPRVSLDTRFAIVDLPEDLDAHLHQAESRFTDITPGAEKTIVWADEKRKHKTPYAFVYLHGFSATRQESAPVPGDIADYFDSNIYYTRLAGNGRGDEAMANGSVNRWIHDASEALAIAERIGEKTILVGCSTGASLAWWIANQKEFSQKISALVFFSPNFGIVDSRASILLYPWGAQIARAIIGEYRVLPPASELQEKYWACRYPTKALLPMMGMVKLTKKYLARNSQLPVFVLYSPQDDTVDASKISQFYEQIPTYKQKFVIDDPDLASKHVLIGDILAPQNNNAVTKAVIGFIKGLPHH